MIRKSSTFDFNSGFSNDDNENIYSMTAGFRDNKKCGEGASCILYQMKLDGMHMAVKRLRAESYRPRNKRLDSKHPHSISK